MALGVSGVLKRTFARWSDDSVTRLSAAVAFYTLLSLAPLVVIVIAIAGFALGRQAAEGQIVQQVQGHIGPQAATAIQEIIRYAHRPGGGISLVLGVIVLLFSASAVFAELKFSLNSLWEVRPKRQDFRAIVRQRVYASFWVLAAGLLLLATIIATTVLDGFRNLLLPYLPMQYGAVRLLNFGVLLVAMGTIFALMFRYVPDVHIRWRDLLPGALVSAILFVVGEFGLGLYLARSAFSTAYGAAGSLVVLLVWVYYSAQIVFLGAEFTAVYANSYGAGIVPDENAVRAPRRAAEWPAEHPAPAPVERRPAA